MASPVSCANCFIVSTMVGSCDCALGESAETTLAPSLRTTAHLPSRFLRRSIQRNWPLVSFPFWVLFSFTRPWATATSPNTCTSTGPFSNHSSLCPPDLKSLRRLSLVKILPEESTVAQSSAKIWLSLSISPATIASPISCPTCFTASTAAGSLEGASSGWAKANPAHRMVNKTVPTSFFICSFFICCPPIRFTVGFVFRHETQCLCQLHERPHNAH